MGWLRAGPLVPRSHLTALDRRRHRRNACAGLGVDRHRYAPSSGSPRTHGYSSRKRSAAVYVRRGGDPGRWAAVLAVSAFLERFLIARGERVVRVATTPMAGAAPQRSRVRCADSRRAAQLGRRTGGQCQGRGPRSGRDPNIRSDRRIILVSAGEATAGQRAHGTTGDRPLRAGVWGARAETPAPRAKQHSRRRAPMAFRSSSWLTWIPDRPFGRVAMSWLPRAG